MAMTAMRIALIFLAELASSMSINLVRKQPPEFVLTGELIEGRETVFNGTCEDAFSDHTGFDIHDDNGFHSHASCVTLKEYGLCNHSEIAADVRLSCPLTCEICERPNKFGVNVGDGPCFDATNTGIRFKEGPKASCKDLVNYCNHTEIGPQVLEACRLTCGACDIFIEGPYLDTYGNCEDKETQEDPQFTVLGALKGCSDLLQFCREHPHSYDVRGKCPLTCGVCGFETSTTRSLTDDDGTIPDDTANCDRRRRYGYCSTRRRRNN